MTSLDIFQYFNLSRQRTSVKNGNGELTGRAKYYAAQKARKNVLFPQKEVKPSEIKRLGFRVTFLRRKIAGLEQGTEEHTKVTSELHKVEDERAEMKIRNKEARQHRKRSRHQKTELAFYGKTEAGGKILFDLCTYAHGGRLRAFYLPLSAVSWQVGSSSLLDGTELNISKMQGRRCMLHSGVGGGPASWPTLGPPTPNFVATVCIAALVELQSSVGPEQ
jgi:hypothetical protein